MKQTVDLQSVVETHEEPFMVIDKDYRIVAINDAFVKAYGIDRERAIGEHCYKTSHNNEAPCSECGEDCPHDQVYGEGKPYTCLHVHYDSAGGVHRVRVKAYPLYNSEGEMYMGEMVRELSTPGECHVGTVRMVGKSKEFLSTVEKLRLAAASASPVLLTGETGTGKELAARFIHNHSPRREGAFLTLDCTVLTESLFESEVFGHERGAFTSSVNKKEGLLEMADGGTLFLDEIGEMTTTLQTKLLRVLETGEFRRVGSNRTLKTDVRVVCATNRSLLNAITDHSFREDLYYRVACIPIQLPALRARLQDIPDLADALLGQLSKATREHKYSLTSDAIKLLQQYHFPGNIRELRNILYGAVTHCSNGVIDKPQISTFLQCRKDKQAVSHRRRATDRQETQEETEEPAKKGNGLDNMEAKHIAELLAKHSGNRRLVATDLGVSERTLYRKLKRYALA